jgi:hypothetical protein
MDIPIDERTEHHGLELPSNIEHLEFDYYRIRNSIVSIDLLLHNLSVKLAQEVSDIEDAIAGMLETLEQDMQPKLVSGQSIRTVNGINLLADGDVETRRRQVIPITQNTQAQAQKSYAMRASLVLMLPDQKQDGDWVWFKNESGTRTCEINGAGSKVCGSLEPMKVDREWYFGLMVYIAADDNWIIYG